MMTVICRLRNLLALAALALAACGVAPTPTEVAPEAPLDTALRTFLADMGSDYGALSPDALTEMLSNDSKPFLLDVRQPDEVEASGHIEGAAVIPLPDLAKRTAQLPAFDTPIVAYSGTGWRSTIGMTVLELAGWNDVHSLLDGSYEGWLERGYPVISGIPPAVQALNAAEPDPVLLAQIRQTLDNIPEGWGVIAPKELNQVLAGAPDLVLIDVRSEDEIKSKGYIEGAERLVIPIEQFLARRAEWPSDKDAAIVTYCGTGHRCTIAMTILWSYGYTNVRNLEGGLKAWVEARYPIAPGT